MPFPVAVLGGAVFAMVIAVPIGYLSVRRTGIYFAMVTLAFAQMIYFVANQWRDLTGGENGLQGIPRNFFGIDPSRPTRSTSTTPACADPARHPGAWRIVHSPVRPGARRHPRQPGPRPRAGLRRRALQVLAFVISAGLAGLAGGVFAIDHGFASLQELNWTTSGKVVLITVLGGIGTLWGGLVGAGASSARGLARVSRVSRASA